MAARSNCGDNVRCWLGKSATGRAKCAFHSGQYSLSRNALAPFSVATLARRRCFTKRSCAVKKLRFIGSFGWGRVAKNGPVSQFAEGSPELRQPVCCALLVFAFSIARRYGEHRIAVRVDVHHPTILLQVLPQHTHVVRCRIALYEAAPAPTGGVVDHAHQVANRPSSFQPVVLRGVPLHQFAKGASTRPPNMPLPLPLRLALPHAGLDHPLPRGLVADFDPMPFGQLLAGECRAEIVPVRLLQKRHSLSLSLGRQLAIGGPPAQPMHDHRVALLDHPLEQLPYPSVAHSHLLGGLPLADASFLGSSQPVQLIPFLLAHRDSFHPLALRLSRGTFYFGQLGTSHFGATPSSYVAERPSGSAIM